MQMIKLFQNYFFLYSVVIISLVLFSCNENNEEQEIKRLLENEYNQISFNEVDQYPFFPNCNEYQEKNENLDCFYSELSKHLTANLDTLPLNATYQNHYVLTIKVDIKGKVILKDVKSSNHQDEFKIKSVLEHQIENMPTLFPAQKRGVLVSSEYQIPLHFKFKD